LPSLGEALVEIGTDDTLVELRAADVFHAVQSVLVGVVFDEAEAAGCFLEAIKAHYESLYLTTPSIGQHDKWHADYFRVLGE
jgi:hypothetical protein